MLCAEHQYKAGAPGVENERTMVFYNVARMDGLAKRVETPTEMTEHFVDRDDFLYYKHTLPLADDPRCSAHKMGRPLLLLVLLW